MATKGYFVNAVWIFDENGELTAPINSTLAHRFAPGEDGEVIDKYDGVSDEEVRQQDHAKAIADAQAAQAAWDAAEEKPATSRPELPAALNLPEE